jgi:hypothetical protein
VTEGRNDLEETVSDRLGRRLGRQYRCDAGSPLASVGANGCMPTIDKRKSLRRDL